MELATINVKLLVSFFFQDPEQGDKELSKKVFVVYNSKKEIRIALKPA